MRELLEVFNTTIEKSGSTITLTYCHPTSLDESGEDIPTNYHVIGTCIYESRSMKGNRLPIVQNFYVLISTDMGDVIEFIHKKSPLSSEDIFVVDKLIRDHSLSRVKDLDCIKI